MWEVITILYAVKLRIKRLPSQRNTSRIKYDKFKLGNEDVLKAFIITLKNKFQALQEEDEELEED